MKLIQLAGLLAALSLAAGCFDSKTVYSVKKDGSGTVTIEDYMSPQMTGVMESMTQQLGQLGSATNAPGAPVMKANMFRAQIDGRCEQIGGEWLTPVSQQTVTNAVGWKGYRAVFAFKDITQLKVPGAKADLAPDPAEKKAAPVAAYTFQFVKGAKPVLKVVPGPKPAATEVKPADPMAEQMMTAMFGSALKGARQTVIVEVDGDIAETNAQFRNGKRQVVLMDVPMDKFAGNAEAMKILSTKSPDQQEKLSKLKVDGVQMEDPSKTVSITFQ